MAIQSTNEAIKKPPLTLDEVAWNKLLKLREKQVEEAAKTMPLEDIGEQIKGPGITGKPDPVSAGLAGQPLPTNQAISPQQAQLVAQQLFNKTSNPQEQIPNNFTPPKNVFGSAQVTPQGIQQSGFLANLFGTSTSTLLDQMNKVSEMNARGTTAPLSALGKVQTGINQRQTEVSEKRREEDSKRRIRQERVNNIKEFGGGIILKEDVGLFAESTGLDINALIETGRANRTPDGKAFSIMDKQKYDRFVEEGKFTPQEQVHMRQIAEEVNAWARIINRMEEIGFKEGDQPFEVIMSEEEAEKNPIWRSLGVFSLPAKFNIVRQFQGDKRVAAVARDIEKAFQKFRTRVTGAQASDKEIERLRVIIASMSDNPAVFFETIRNNLQDSTDDFNIYLGMKKALKRDTSEFDGFLETLPAVKAIGGTTKFKKGDATSESAILSKLGLDPNKYTIRSVK